MRQCYYCKRWFKNKQAVRAHLRWCPEYSGSKGPIVTPGFINIPQQHKSGTPEMAQDYRINPEGSYIDPLNRKPPETASDYIWPVDICVIHRGCMVCPYCLGHIRCEDRRPQPASREGRCPYCDGLFLYWSGTRLCLFTGSFLSYIGGNKDAMKSHKIDPKYSISGGFGLQAY
jgi:hypothetical protein